MSAHARGPRELTALVGPDEAVLCFALDGPSAGTLTAAESEVVVALLAGRSNAEIARARGRSVRTIANQVASILRKLGVGSRFELAARAATLPTRR